MHNLAGPAEQASEDCSSTEPSASDVGFMTDTSQFVTYARLLRLIPVKVDGLPLADTETPVTEKDVPKTRRKFVGAVSFAIMVLLPTLLAITYFYAISANRYQSEARFVLRMPGRSAANAATTNLLQSMGVIRSTEDGYIVREYLESRDAMAILGKNGQLQEIYEKPRWDFIWRFPNPFMSNSEEGLYRQYKRMISTSFDSSTGVNLLKVQAFAPADARRLAGELLKAAEALVNHLNERARNDTVAFAEAESDRARKRVVQAQAMLAAFRERERLVDPSQATLAVLEAIAKLSTEVAQVSVQLGELAKASPNAPQIGVLRGRRTALEAQIATERQRLAGDTQSIAPKIAEYERLTLEREFAEKALMAAMASVELARIEASRQQVYLEQVATPSEPDYPTYPWRLIWCLATFAAGYMAWRTWRVWAADTLRHTNL